ncbi:MAG: phospho-N-acetylmuramoyl-pentapeptide-transferase [Bacteriovoracaceae bacterium]|jgi:phospho-N-acetylmuramoyl-pentapeptide-transferase|nr:phospho-N-acetylmuramoyl-pentapeptide-transferase [Bacteriovoracaceae bacterium]
MLFHFLYPLSSDAFIFNVFKYITFRTFIAFILATAFSIILGKKFIKFMQKKQFGQFIRDDGPSSHLKKQGTPTMGGIFIIGSIILTMLITGNFNSYPILISLFVMLSYFFLGFRDDYLKVIYKNSKGVSAKGKLVWQILTAAVAGFLLIKLNVIDTTLRIPFLKEPLIDLGSFYILFIVLVIVGSSNAVNLTDGLDGLVSGPVITSSATLGILAYITGHYVIANYLYIPHIQGASELAVLAMATVGATVGFLWYNTYPAQIFMGDVGSLSLGGLLGTIAVVTKNEILFVVIGGVFVMEAISVILQVGSYKLRKKRIFKMAPIHHHFELKGWAEPKVIVRFWVISIILAILSLATLKLR